MGNFLDLTQVASSSGGGGASSWKTPVATYTSLPAGTDGDACVVIDEATVYVYASGAWHISGESAFNFSDLSGYCLDLDIADPAAVPGASNGVAQSTVNDKSSSGYVMLQSTGANQPIYHSSGLGSNSKPYLNFNGTTQFMQSTVNFALTGDAASTILIVCDITSAAVDQTPFGWGDSSSGGAGAGSYIVAGGKYCSSYAGGINYNTNTVMTTGLQILVFVKAAGAINTHSAIYKNGALLAIGTGSSAATPSIGNKPFAMGIWADYSGTTFTGKQGRIVGYNRDLTAFEVGQIMNKANSIYGGVY